jgi:aminopeptidase
MMDPRIEKLANILIDYSCSIKKGEKILLDCYGSTAKDLLKALIRQVYSSGGIPFYNLKDNSISREIVKNCSHEQLRFMRKIDLAQMKEMDAYVGIRAYENVNEMADVDRSKVSQYIKDYSKDVVDWRVKKTKWVVLRYPNNSMAQLANTSLESFQDFYFNVCNLDYKKMSEAMDSLVGFMEKTDKVTIKGQNTDLSFSIKGIPAIKCAGIHNIPDGEVFTAPIKNSVNGIISFNIPQIEHGITFENISMVFKNGKIVEARSNETVKLNEILDTDSGSRYIGEFSLGVNPHITRPMKDGLFDEKIMGSFHFTPGKCYEEADNGNKSALHWDMVYIQTPEYGGGEIYFDDVLIRKDGKFVVRELEKLNPENLV